jgi:hypothetical protein
VAVTEEGDQASWTPTPSAAGPERCTREIVVKGWTRPRDPGWLREERGSPTWLVSSLSADAKDGGDLGWFPRGVMPPSSTRWLSPSGAGQISEVVT